MLVASAKVRFQPNTGALKMALASRFCVAASAEISQKNGESIGPFLPLGVFRAESVAKIA
jgi:hypothetical protein